MEIGDYFVSKPYSAPYNLPPQLSTSLGNGYNIFTKKFRPVKGSPNHTQMYKNTCMWVSLVCIYIYIYIYVTILLLDQTQEARTNMFILFLTSQPRHPTFRKSCRNTCERDCRQIFFWLIIQHIFYFFFNPSILKCTKTILLYPRVILILSSLYLQQKFSSVQLLGSQQFINYSKKKRQLNEWPYRSSRLNLLSISTGYPN